LFGQVDQMIKWFHADDVAALLYRKEAPYMGKTYSGKPISAKSRGRAAANPGLGDGHVVPASARSRGESR
jgi:hypothetical protein